jgi:putative oxidoreductase
VEAAFLIGRLIVGVFYLYNAGNHFFRLQAMTEYAESKRVPYARALVLVAGVLLLVGGLCILSGFRPTVGVISLVIFFLPVMYQMHAFWKVDDPRAQMAEIVNFTKDAALMGSALMFLAIPQPWPYALG